MFSIELLDRSFNHEVEELIRAFFPFEEVVDGFSLEGYSLRNSLKGGLGTTGLYFDGNLIEEKNFQVEEEKRQLKNNIKRNVYDLLEKLSARSLPWGILTGIRPSKLVHELMDQGLEDDLIGEILRRDYRISDEKLEFIIGISRGERKYLYPLDSQRYSIYISIPFCPSKCLYCSFPSASIARYKDSLDSYTEKLIRELELVSESLDKTKISTVYIGGGTPTALDLKNLEAIIGAVKRIFKRENIEEFTVEAGRPDTLNKEYLDMLKRNKIDRISINPQTMRDDSLKVIGRSHTSKDIEELYYMAKDDFTVNMDLIVGLPGEGEEDISYSMEKIREMDPDNVTIHTLSVKRGSRFALVMDKYSVADGDTIESMLELTGDYLKAMGQKPYYLYRQKQSLGNFENIGYAKEGLECIYNIKMMEERETIFGFGVGAVSKIFDPEDHSIKRVPNVKSIEEYLTRYEEMADRKIRGFKSIG